MRVDITPIGSTDAMNILAKSQFSEVESAIQSLHHHIMLSENTWVAKLDNVPVVMWGVIPPSVLSSRAYVWLVASNDIGKKPHVKFLFIRYTQRIVEIMLKKHEALYGFCYPEESQSIKWLKFLGAKFEKPHDGKLPFRIGRM